MASPHALILLPVLDFSKTLSLHVYFSPNHSFPTAEILDSYISGIQKVCLLTSPNKPCTAVQECEVVSGRQTGGVDDDDA